MEWTDEFEPTSQINGNIEITFNSKNKEFDIYEPIQEQLVLTVGKTGRANRLTFDAPTSQELIETAELLKELGEQVKDLEKEAKIDSEEFDAENIECGVTPSLQNKIMDAMPDDDSSGVLLSDLNEKFDVSVVELEDKIEQMMRIGEIYRTGNGSDADPEYAKI